MDWIERIFHTSPDQGSGAVELTLFLIACMAAPVLLTFLRNGLVRAMRKVRSTS